MLSLYIYRAFSYTATLYKRDLKYKHFVYKGLLKYRRLKTICLYLLPTTVYISTLHYSTLLNRHLKSSHTTAYDISVCQIVIIRSHILCRYILGVRQAYLVYGPITLTNVGVRFNTLMLNMFWTWSTFSSVCERIAYAILMRSPYTRQYLNKLDIR